MGDRKRQYGEVITRRDEGCVFDAYAYASPTAERGLPVLLVGEVEFPVPLSLLPKAVEPGTTVRFSLSIVKRASQEELARARAGAEEESRLLAEAEAQRRAEEQKRLRAETEAQRRAEEEARLRADRQAEEAEQRRLAEEATRKQESGTRRKR